MYLGLKVCLIFILCRFPDPLGFQAIAELGTRSLRNLKVVFNLKTSSLKCLCMHNTAQQINSHGKPLGSQPTFFPTDQTSSACWPYEDGHALFAHFCDHG